MFHIIIILHSLIIFETEVTVNILISFNSEIILFDRNFQIILLYSIENFIYLLEIVSNCKFMPDWVST